MKTINKYLFKIVLSIIFLGCSNSQSEKNLMPSNSENSEKKEQALTWDTNKQDFINSFLNSGGEIDVEGKKAYMPPGFWNQIDHNQKADVTCVIAQYCEHKKHSGVTYANIYDKMSGKKLAKWSNTTGLTVE